MRIPSRPVCIAAMTLILCISGPASGQSKATCAAYRAADTVLYSTPAIRDQSLIQRILIIVVTRKRNSEMNARERAVQDEMIGLLDRVMGVLQKSPVTKRAYQTARHARRKAYQGPVVKDASAMADLVRGDIWRCKKRYRDWPTSWYPNGRPKGN